MESGDEDEDTAWFRPVWQTDEDTEPPGRPLPRRQAVVEPDYTHPLLTPLARAQDAVARLEASAAAAAPAIAEGLRARLSYREAAGWLAYAHVWIHPRDLALRDASVTGSYGAAAHAGCLETQLPATTAHGTHFEEAPSDRAVERALRLAHLWRHLAERRTWSPLETPDSLDETMQYLHMASARGAAEEWLASLPAIGQGPALIRAGRAARDWMNRPATTKPLTADGIFLAACLWRQGRDSGAIPLPFWLASEQRLNRLALQTGLAWMAAFLECVADAARASLADLGRLQLASEKGKLLARTARSKLPAAFDCALRSPVLTARSLADRLKITPQAALGLLRQLAAHGVVREATARASWRVYVLS